MEAIKEVPRQEEAAASVERGKDLVSILNPSPHVKSNRVCVERPERIDFLKKRYIEMPSGEAKGLSASVQLVQ